MSTSTKEEKKKFGKKDMAAMLSGNLAMMKEFAKSNPKLLAMIDEQEKKLKDAMGEDKVVGPCAGCKESKTVQSKNYDYEYARWFMCPHKDLFCPDCLKANHEVAKKKRKEEKEIKSKKK